MKGNIPSRPASITWRQLVIAPRASDAAWARTRLKAESLYAELTSGGGEFERVARRESMDADTKDLGGDRGWARRGVREPEFDALAFGTPTSAPLRPGQVSRPIETPLGIHLYRIDRVQPGEVKSRHIFLRPAIDSADVRRAGVQADSVAAAIRAGAPFDTLTRRYHDYASKEDAGLIPFPRDSLPLAYQEAFRNAKIGDIVIINVPGISDNIPKYVVAQLSAMTEGGQMTLTELREWLRDQMARSGGMRRYLDRLRKEIHVVSNVERAYQLAGAR
jgi:hypothetical protein